ncbi:MAG TPA: hypothetical protein VIR32_03580 [Lachnospiraceae bacterium]
MKKYLVYASLLMVMAVSVGCTKANSKKDLTTHQEDTSSLTEDKKSEDDSKNLGLKEDAKESGEVVDGSNTPGTTTQTPSGSVQAMNDEYPYDIAADRPNFDSNNIDIVVGDNLYVTQINDWYTNFADYAGKSVEIEGYYMDFGGYHFVGRNGPSCPYCTGGYVNFEFQTDQDMSSYISIQTWIKVKGILREGLIKGSGKRKDQPFYYIEAISVEEMPEVGVDTVTQ